MVAASRVFVSRNEKVSGYEVWGWRYLEDRVWRVKLWPEIGDRKEHAYLVANGKFEPDTVLSEEKLIVLQLLKKWESGLRDKPRVTRDQG
jgi:hypothetical protein